MDFQEEIEKIILCYDEKTQHNIRKWIETLTEIEKTALLIAKNHLETSFNIKKCNGFVNWLEEQENINTNTTVNTNTKK